MDGFVHLLIPTRIPLYASLKPHRPATHDRHWPAEQVDEHGLECLLVLSADHALDNVDHGYSLLLETRTRGDSTTKVCSPE